MFNRLTLTLFSQGVDEESDAGTGGEAKGAEKDGEHSEACEEGVHGDCRIFHARSGDGEDHVDFGEDKPAKGAVANKMVGGRRIHGASGEGDWVSAAASGWSFGSWRKIWIRRGIAAGKWARKSGRFLS